MTAARFVAPALAALILATGSAVRAQDYSFQGFAAMDAMNTLHANNLDLTLRASGADNTPRQWRNVPRDQRHGGASTPPAASAPTTDMRFRRDPAVTREVQAELVRTVSRTAPEAGREMAALFEGADPIAAASPFFRGYSLDTANVVDAVTIYYLAMWGVANDQEARMTRDQARGARAHVARVVAFDAMGLTTPAARQRFAETLVYQGLLMDAAIERAQIDNDPALRRTLSDAAHRQMTSLGLDMRRLAITGEGFVPR